MLIYQIHKILPDGTPEVLCGGISKIMAELILEESYPEEDGKVVWLDEVRREGKLRIVDGRVMK